MPQLGSSTARGVGDWILVHRSAAYLDTWRSPRPIAEDLVVLMVPQLHVCLVECRDMNLHVQTTFSGGLVIYVLTTHRSRIIGVPVDDNYLPRTWLF